MDYRDYITIEPNKTVTGMYAKHGVQTVTGYKVTQFNAPPMIVGSSSISSYIINGNNAWFQKTSSSISAWNIKN